MNKLLKKTFANAKEDDKLPQQESLMAQMNQDTLISSP